MSTIYYPTHSGEKMPSAPQMTPLPIMRTVFQCLANVQFFSSVQRLDLQMTRAYFCSLA